MANHQCTISACGMRHATITGSRCAMSSTIAGASSSRKSSADATTYSGGSREQPPEPCPYGCSSVSRHGCASAHATPPSVVSGSEREHDARARAASAIAARSFVRCSSCASVRAHGDASFRRRHVRRALRARLRRRAAAGATRTRARRASAARARAETSAAREAGRRVGETADERRARRRRAPRSRRASSSTVRYTTATKTESTANTGSAELCSHGRGDDAADGDLLGVRLHEIDRRRHDERQEPEAPRELDADARRAAVERTPTAPARRQAARAAAMRLREAPREAREHQRDADLHAGEQERVVVGVRVARRADAAADVEAMRRGCGRASSAISASRPSASAASSR